VYPPSLSTRRRRRVPAVPPRPVRTRHPTLQHHLLPFSHRSLPLFVPVPRLPGPLARPFPLRSEGPAQRTRPLRMPQMGTTAPRHRPHFVSPSRRRCSLHILCADRARLVIPQRRVSHYFPTPPPATDGPASRGGLRSLCGSKVLGRAWGRGTSCITNGEKLGGGLNTSFMLGSGESV
jgi:hypothetical protein